jgi:hypothetical protein
MAGAGQSAGHGLSTRAAARPLTGAVEERGAAGRVEVASGRTSEGGSECRCRPDMISMYYCIILFQEGEVVGRG